MTQTDLDRIQAEEFAKLWQEQEAERLERQQQYKREQLQQSLDNSLMGERYYGLTFDSVKVTPSNEDALRRCRNYVANSEEVLKHNLGLYFYGANSVGKTFMTAVLCNELIAKGYTCLFTSLDEYTKAVLGMHDRGVDEKEITTLIKRCDFVIWDDVGKEFMQKEENANKAKWKEGQFYQAINARYNANKPTIFSSNYTIRELSEVLSLDRAIVDRIDEMATRVIRIDGVDFRQQEKEQKASKAKGLGI